jgi:sugar lactone lactonase YvrE
MKGIAKMTSAGTKVLLCTWLCFCTASADTLYVSTDALNTIWRVDSGGNVSTFATSASGLDYPNGMALDEQGNLFVANGLSDTIQEFNSDGGTGTVFATSGLAAPFCLAFDETGDLFVGNLGNNTIEEYGPGGTGLVFATASSGINEPQALALDDAGNLYVADYNDTILKFTTNGLASTFATSGLSNPQGLAFDRNGNLYVANHGNNTIEVFNPAGQGSVFTSTNLLDQPVGLAFGSSGDLYAASGGSDILEFTTNGTGSVFASGVLGAGDMAIQQIPEPTAFLLLALGLLVLALPRALALSRRGSLYRPRRHFLTSTTR